MNLDRGEKKCIHNFGGETFGGRPLERPRMKCKDITKIDLT